MMNIARHKLKDDLNLPLSLTQEMGWAVVPHSVGDQIKRYIEGSKDDIETVTFENVSGDDIEIDFYLDPLSGTTTFLSGGDCASSVNEYFFQANNFCEDDIDQMSAGFRKSYFIIEVYDSPFISKQNKFDTLFLHLKTTQGGESKLSNSEFESNYLRYINIPRWFVDEKVKGNNLTSTVYLKAYFFNAKNGIVYEFRGFNSTNSLEKELATYEPLIINLETFTYNKVFYSFQVINNVAVDEKINTPSIELKRPVPRFPNKLGFDSDNLPDLFAEEGAAGYNGDEGTGVVAEEHEISTRIAVNAITVTNISAVNAGCELSMDVSYTTEAPMHINGSADVIIYSEFAMLKDSNTVNIPIIAGNTTSNVVNVRIEFPGGCGVFDVSLSYGVGLKEGVGFADQTVTPDCTNCEVE